MPTKCFCLSILALSCASAFAAQSGEESIEKIEVWSTQVTTSSQYLRGDDIARKQADHISDLLRTIPGVDVGGAHSLNQRLTIRSLGDKDLNISIDGANQNTYMYHHMGNLQIHADILKSVDIEIGSNSIVNGGLGGAVRFETKDAKELLARDQQFGSRIQLAGGDNSGSNMSFTGYGELTHGLDFLAYYNVVNRDNYSVGGDKILDADGVEVAGTNGEVVGLKGELYDALVKVGVDINDDQRLALSIESYQDEGDYSYRPDMGLATDLAITNSLAVPLLWPTEFSRHTTTLKYDHALGDHTQIGVTLFNNVSELTRDESGWAVNDSFAPWAGQVTGEAKNTGVNMLADSELELGVEHQFTYGIDYIEFDTDYKAEYQTGTIDASSESSGNLGLFVQDRIELTHNFALIPGVRFDRFDIDSKLVDGSFSKVSLAMAAEYRVGKDFLVKLSTTELFKGPEMGEVFVGAGLNDTANPDIKAETGVNTELALAYQTKIKPGGDLSMGVTLFDTEISDYIYDYASIPGGTPRQYWKDNIGDMKITGFEAYLGYRAGALDVQLTYSQSESELYAFADYQGLDKHRLDRQQGDTVSGNLGYLFEPLNVKASWEIQQVASVDTGLNLDGASKDNAKDGFTVHNLAVNWQPEALPELSLLFGIDNVFDEFYASQSSRTGVSVHPRFGDLYLTDYEPGRNVKVTVGYRF